MASAHHGPAASSANAAATRRATPDTSTAKCSSAWLRLWGSKGESCYSGDGSLAVDLPGIYRAQIVGEHQACLSAADEFKTLCMTGPGTFAISPPVQVLLITITTSAATIESLATAAPWLRVSR